MRFRVLQIGRGAPARRALPQKNRKTEPDRKETVRPAQTNESGESSAQAARRAALQNPYGRYYSAPRTPEDLIKAKR
jgi:hypothetical protein